MDESEAAHTQKNTKNTNLTHEIPWAAIQNCWAATQSSNILYGFCSRKPSWPQTGTHDCCRNETWMSSSISEEDGTADCSHMILASVGLQSFLFLPRKSRGPRAGATPASDTLRGQRRHSPTHSHLATPRQPFLTLLRWQGLILRWAKTYSPSVMYIRPEETDNHLPRSSVALRIPVTRKNV